MTSLDDELDHPRLTETAIVVCTGCRHLKSIDHFAFSARNKNRYHRQAWCRTCNKLARRAAQAKDPERHRAANRRWKRKATLSRHGLTEAEYDEMFARQQGLCGICAEPGTKRSMDTDPERLLIDHDHVEGIIRGLLCSNCNTAIGLLGDSPERMEAAAAYVRRQR